MSSLPYTAYVNRPLAQRLVLIGRRFTPNQISYASFVILLASLAAIPFVAGTGWIAAAYLGLAFNYLLDGLDGEVARARSMSSPFGEWLDHALDGVRLLAIHVTFGGYLTLTQSPLSTVILVGIALNLICHPGTFCATMLKDKILGARTGAVLAGQRSARQVATFLFATPSDHGIFVMVSLFLYDPAWFAVAYAAYGFYFAVVMLGVFVLTAKGK